MNKFCAYLSCSQFFMKITEYVIIFVDLKLPLVIDIIE